MKTHALNAALTPHLSFYGGRILRNPSFVSLYAGSFWSSPQGRSQQAPLERCSASIPTGASAAVWSEYGVSKGTFAGSSVVAFSPTKRRVTEKDVQNIVASGIWRTGVKRPDGKTVYTVFLPPGVTLIADGTDSQHGLGGFHGSYTDTKTGKPVYYAVVAYADEKNGLRFTNNSVDNMTIAASHEWSEAVTDPDVNAGKLGWYDRNFGEVGDIPINVGYPLSQLWGRVGGCAVQKEWSNTQGRPVL